MSRVARTQTTTVPQARGGVAGGAIVTGVVVSFGAMFLLSAIVGGVLVALGATDGNITQGEAIDAGLGAGIALVVAQFLSYFWGGYTAGRMARGAGVANGVLVPIVALILGGATVAIVAALGADANLNLPFSTNSLPVEDASLVDWGIGIGVAALVAMFLGGIVGGAAGARWHTKLERDAEVGDHSTAHTVVVNEHRTDSTVDLRDQDRVDDVRH